jgi:uncharacterized OB-fold protein
MSIPELSGKSASGLAAEYFAWHAKREFRLQRCQSCRRWQHPATETCPVCGSVEMAWEQASGDGSLYTWTVTHHPYSAELSELIPYAPVVVACVEGPRVLSTVIDMDISGLTAGMALTVRFAEGADGAMKAVFAPASDHGPAGATP